MRLYKSLLPFLIALAALGYINQASACSLKSLKQVDKCTVNDKLLILLGKNAKFETSDDSSKSDYERIIMDNKPSMTELEARLVTWKENAKVKVRFAKKVDSIKYLRRAMVACGINEANDSFFAENLKKSLNQATLTCLEDNQSQIQTERDQKKQEAQQKKQLLKAIKEFNCGSLQGYLKRVCQYNKLEL